MNDHAITSEAHDKADVLLRRARAIVALMMYSADEAEGSEMCVAAEAVMLMLDEAHDLIGHA